ncbi:hypothetical protein ACOI1H_18115 [Loktanella sp. DJP18]|uniref:hypothetical protein n=1 Tax=Loktanella sp. DJP18 TaxID=3409788 RepID=UPI003BB6EC4E
MPSARLLILCLLLAGCADAPSLDGRISAAAAAAPYPTLQPLAPLLARAATPGQITAASTARMDGDTAGLRARAAALRGPVVDAATRTRMQGGVARAALR